MSLQDKNQELNTTPNEGSKARNSGCLNCQYYFITWDKSAPHGCRYFGMKTKMLPEQIVKTASGILCEGYKVKGLPKQNR